MTNVSWFGANAFANYYDWHLPDDYEWEKAARGNTGYEYPFGNSIDNSQANYWESGDPWDNGTTPVGFYNGQYYEGFQTTDSPSPYGAYDMAGNVHEWIYSWYSESLPYRNRRGGLWSYMGGSPSGCRAWIRDGTNPTGTSISLGFRVARTN